jgi:NAD(P)-dependent dehydrogenase (short-subunit alcohol dehydrogenase family)
LEVIFHWKLCDTETKDCLSIGIVVNHLGHFLLANLLLASLDQSLRPRIVVVASDLHDPARAPSFAPRPKYTSAKQLAYPDDTEIPDCRYPTSKLCNVFFAYELAKRLQAENQNIDVCAYNPGFIPGTGLMKGHIGEYSYGQGAAFGSISKVCMH